MKAKRGICRECRRPIARDVAGRWAHEDTGLASGFQERPTWFGIGMAAVRHEAKPLRYLNGKQPVPR